MIEHVLTSLYDTIDAAIIIAQHMDRRFLDSFAKRLNRIYPVDVVSVSQNIEIQSGRVYVLQETSMLQWRHHTLVLEEQKPLAGYYHPTIDTLFSSAAQLNSIAITAYLLSGIGMDGAKGMLALKHAGFKTVTQDERTSIVYGMPKRAWELGASQQVLSIDEIINDINMEVT